MSLSHYELLSYTYRKKTSFQAIEYVQLNLLLLQMAGSGHNLDLSLGISVTSDGAKGNGALGDSHFLWKASEVPNRSGRSIVSS